MIMKNSQNASEQKSATIPTNLSRSRSKVQTTPAPIVYKNETPEIINIVQQPGGAIINEDLATDFD